MTYDNDMPRAHAEDLERHAITLAVIDKIAVRAIRVVTSDFPVRSGEGIEPSKRGAATPCRF